MGRIKTQSAPVAAGANIVREKGRHDEDESRFYALPFWWARRFNWQNRRCLHAGIAGPNPVASINLCNTDTIMNDIKQGLSTPVGLF